MIDLNKCQKELFKWQKENFPGVIIQDLAIGMSEEVGETCHHILKGIQRIREGQEGIDPAQVADDIMDTFIYGLQILSILGVDAEEALTTTASAVLSRDWNENKEDGKPKVSLEEGQAVRRISNHTIAYISKIYEDNQDIVGVTIIPQKGNPNVSFERWLVDDLELLDYVKKGE